VTRRTRNASAFLCALLGLAVAAPAVRAEEGADAPAAGKRYARIHVIDFEGEIEPALTAYAERRIERAEKEGADLIVFRIESPGGRVDVTQDLSDRILRVKKGVRTLAWVPEYAYSGAAIVAISCDEIVMAPRSYMGDAQPILLTAEEGIKPAGEKAETVLRAMVRSLAEDNGYPSLLCEKLISQDMEVVALEAEGKTTFVLGEEWRDARDDDAVAGRPKREWKKTRVFPRGQLLTMRAPEAEQLGFASRLVRSEAALLESLSEAGAVVVHHRMTASERAGRWLLGIAGILGALVMLGILGTVFGGSQIALIVTVAGFVLLGLIGATADLAHGFPLFLVVVGVLLLLVEAFLVPGFGIPGVLGILCFSAGLLFAITGYRPGNPTTVDGDAIRDYALQLVATLVVGGVVFLALARLFPSSPFGRRLLIPAGALPAGSVATPTGSGAAVLPAREGTALTPLRPAGTARLGDSLVDVVTEGDFVDEGARVRVVRVEGSRVVVRPVAG
jgi:membrane-bound serine protease (ClpP class)